VRLPNQSAGIRRVGGVPPVVLDRGVTPHQVFGGRPGVPGIGPGEDAVFPKGCAPCHPAATDEERRQCPSGCVKYCSTSDGADLRCCLHSECVSCGACNVATPPTFSRTCTDPITGATTTTPCNPFPVCFPEFKIDLPFPLSDRCVRICCTSFDPSSCSPSVRTC